jgi:hypothetical protein
MAEANPSIQQTLTAAQARALGFAVVVLARQQAIKAVKQQMRSQGLKLPHIEHKIIVAAADEYLANHRSELIADARAIVDRWHAEGRFGKRGGFRRS